MLLKLSTIVCVFHFYTFCLIDHVCPLLGCNDALCSVFEVADVQYLLVMFDLNLFIIFLYKLMFNCFIVPKYPRILLTMKI